MQRVAVLSHVKASLVPASLSSSGVRRVAWQGGKLSSNKEEAIQKFYQRKLRAGDHPTAHQIKDMQTPLDKTHKKAETMHATGRPHVKVMAYDNITVLKTGRVLGPKPSFKHTASGKKIGRKSRACRQTKAIKTPRTMVENTSVSLEHKLDLPLDALVDANNIGSHKSKRRRTSS